MAYFTYHKRTISIQIYFQAKDIFGEVLNIAACLELWTTCIILQLYNISICSSPTNQILTAKKKGQSRETDNIGYTRRRKTKQKHNALCVGHHYMPTISYLNYLYSDNCMGVF
jgi:hypothetical protein